MENYVLSKRISAGSFGEVFLGHEKKGKSDAEAPTADIAIKVIDCKNINEVCQESRFEVFMMKKISHENIMQVVDFFHVPSPTEALPEAHKLHIVFELMDMNLLNYMKTYFPCGLSEKIIKSFMKQLLRGLSFLHENRILHRDVKPENILICLETNVIKLCDFGLARYYKYENGKSVPLCPNIGTLCYRAPEMLFGKMRAFSPSVDIWSAGCVMGEFVKNEVVFSSGEDEQQIEVIESALRIGSLSVGADSVGDTRDCTGYSAGSSLVERFGSDLSASGLELLQLMLTHDASLRVTAEEALQHAFFACEESASDADTSPNNSDTRIEGADL